MNSHSWLQIFLFFVLLTACKTQEIQTSSKGCKVSEISDFEYMTLRSRINYDEGGNKMSFVANIRLKKDSIIWISAGTGTGVEGIRCLIRQDSLFVIDKLAKKCLSEDIGVLRKRYGYNINFQSLQNIILGNITFLGNKKLKFSEEGDYCVANQTLKPFQLFYSINMKTSKLENFKVLDPSTNNQLTIDYSDFKNIDDKVLPHVINLLLEFSNKGKDASIGLEIIQRSLIFTDKNLKFPFRVPSKYECN